MENRINQIMTLEDNVKYMILKQVIYNNENYFMASKLDENNDPTEEFSIFYETKENGEIYVEVETDEKKLKVILEHLQKAL